MQIIPYNQKVPETLSNLFRMGKVYVRMKHAVQSAKVPTDMAAPRIRLGNISESTTQVTGASDME